MNKVIIRRDSMDKSRNVFETRFDRHLDELKWLYIELYGNDAMFAELCDTGIRKTTCSA